MDEILHLYENILEHAHISDQPKSPKAKGPASWFFETWLATLWRRSGDFRNPLEKNIQNHSLKLFLFNNILIYVEELPSNYKV